MRTLSMVLAITWCAILMHLLVFSSPINAVGDENLLRELKDVRDSAMSQWNAALLEVTNPVRNYQLIWPHTVPITRPPDHYVNAPLWPSKQSHVRKNALRRPKQLS